jgi:hypothetical protein
MASAAPAPSLWPRRGRSEPPDAEG